MTITLVIIFPTIVWVLQVALVLKLDAALPANGMNCDATNPTWYVPQVLFENNAHPPSVCRVRLFGYAGLTLLLSVPSFVLSLMTAMRLFFKPPHPPLQKSRPVSRVLHSQASLTTMPPRRARIRENKPQSSIFESQLVTDGHTSPYLKPSPLIPHKDLPDSPGRAPVLAKHSKFHLPFDVPPSPTLPHSRCSSTLSHVPSQLRDSPVSILVQAQAQVGAETEDAPLPHPRTHHRPHSQSLSQSHSPSPIIFASPSRDGSQTNTVVIHVAPSAPPSVTEIVLGVPVADDEDDVLSEEDVVEEPLSLWASKPDRLSIAKDSLMYGAADEDGRSLYGLSPYPRIRRLASGGKCLPPVVRCANTVLTACCRAPVAGRARGAGAVPRAHGDVPAVRVLDAGARGDHVAHRHPHARTPRARAARDAARRAAPRGMGPLPVRAHGAPAAALLPPSLLDVRPPRYATPLRPRPQYPTSIHERDPDRGWNPDS